MSLEKINKKREMEKQQNIDAVRTIIEEHGSTTSIKKIKGYLLLEFDLDVSIASIKRYRTIIKNETKQEVPQETKAETKYPYFVYCPICKAKGKITANEAQNVVCPKCGLEFNRKFNTWVHVDSGQVYGEISTFVSPGCSGPLSSFDPHNI